MKREAVSAAVRALVSAVVADSVGMPVTPEPDEPLLSSGLIDSLCLVDLLARMGAELGLEIQPADVTLENFDTIARIETFAMGRIGDE